MACLEIPRVALLVAKLRPRLLMKEEVLGRQGLQMLATGMGFLSDFPFCCSISTTAQYL